MYRFKKVGVVLDLKKPNTFVLDHAQELVNTNNAAIHLICALRDELADEQRQKIENFIKQKVDFDFSLVYLIGKPIVEITRYVDQENLDLLLIEPDDPKKTHHFFYGSLVLSLMRKTPCPIWVVKRPVTKNYERILIAVDPQEETTDAALNDKLIEIGTSYAKQQSAECYLATAWRLVGEDTLSGPFINTLPNELERLRNEQKIECARAFEKLQNRHQNILKDCQTQMIYGEPGYAIPEFVKKQKIDLVIMGTVGRGGIKGFLIGNTAETIINQIECSIMAVKPDGFISPILQ